MTNRIQLSLSHTNPKKLPPPPGLGPIKMNIGLKLRESVCIKSVEASDIVALPVSWLCAALQSVAPYWTGAQHWFLFSFLSISFNFLRVEIMNVSGSWSTFLWLFQWPWGLKKLIWVKLSNPAGPFFSLKLTYKLVVHWRERRVRC